MPVNLPSETLDEIISYVEPYTDVLNIALSNKALSSVAIPQHLHYRDIRSKLHNPPLWSWLSRLDDLHAAHIRSLTIIPDHDYDIRGMSPEHLYDIRERLPAEFYGSESQPLHSLTAEDCRVAETKLISALKRMSCLHKFRWYRAPRPVLDGGEDIWSTLERLGTVKELDILDVEVVGLDVVPIALSDTFLRLSGFTSLKLRTSVCDRSNDDPEIHQLEQMLMTNCPGLEVLTLELDLHSHIDTANIETLLQNAHWPNLRVLRLRGVNCRVPELVRFLTAHPTLEELALAQMMPGHAWTQLEIPPDALPNLRHLECSSAQAAALLKNASAWPLETLLGVELHDRVVLATYFSWDEDWEEEDHEDENVEVPSPWKSLLLDRIKAQSSVICLGIVHVDESQEVEALSRIAPQLRELDICARRDIDSTEWHRLYALFPALEVIRAAHLIWFQPYVKPIPETASKINGQIQALARACPKLRLVWTGPRAKKAVIVSGGGQPEGVRWVVRRWVESEDPVVKEGEDVYGP